MFEILIDAAKVRMFEARLAQFRKGAFPVATRQTLNAVAFKARALAQENIREKMVERNSYTRNSIRVEKAVGSDVSAQFSRVGSVADYMDEQEFGGTKTKKGKEGTPIATGYSAGQAGQRPRTRLPRRANTLRAIQLLGGGRIGDTSRQRNAISVRRAEPNSFVFLESWRFKGLFRVVGKGRRRAVRMVHDLSRESVSIPKRPWLGPAVDAATVAIPRLYLSALRDQCARIGFFGPLK